MCILSVVLDRGFVNVRSLGYVKDRRTSHIEVDLNLSEIIGRSSVDVTQAGFLVCLKCFTVFINFIKFLFQLI